MEFLLTRIGIFVCLFNFGCGKAEKICPGDEIFKSYGEVEYDLIMESTLEAILSKEQKEDTLKRCQDFIKKHKQYDECYLDDSKTSYVRKVFTIGPLEKLCSSLEKRLKNQ